MNAPLALSVQGTPNPNAVKFTLNRTVAAQGTTYRDAAAAQADWAKQLLSIAGVTQVFAAGNFISVSKAPEAGWDAIIPPAEAALRTAFAGADAS